MHFTNKLKFALTKKNSTNIVVSPKRQFGKQIDCDFEMKRAKTSEWKFILILTQNPYAYAAR